MKTRNKKINANVIRTLNPIDRKEKIKLFKGKNDLNTFIKNKNNKNKNLIVINKNKFQNRTFFEQNEKENLPKINQANYKKNNICKPKLRHINSEHFTKIKAIRSSSQENKNDVFSAHKKVIELLNNKLEKEMEKEETTNDEKLEQEKMLNFNLEEFMEKIKNDFSDIGNLVKMSFVVDDKRKFQYEKNEFVILKIIENDLKQNQGLNIKEFVLNEQKLNIYKSLKENKIENNSVIKVIL